MSIQEKEKEKEKETLVNRCLPAICEGNGGRVNVGFWKEGKKGMWALGNKETKPLFFLPFIKVFFSF